KLNVVLWTPSSGCSRLRSAQSTFSASHSYVLPEEKTVPNTVFVGGIDIWVDELEIKEYISRFFGLVKEVKIITDQNGMSKGYGFVPFYDDVDVQKIIYRPINFQGKKFKLGPAIRKQPNSYPFVQPRHIVQNTPAPQYRNIWNNQNTDPYPSSPPVTFQQYPLGYQQPGYYQVPPHWQVGMYHQKSYLFPPAFTVNYTCSEFDQSIEIIPQKKCVDHSFQTVVFCLEPREQTTTVIHLHSPLCKSPAATTHLSRSL
uniref:DAZ-like protein n=1 Tax=Leptobrachium leishanense TaxID=445787 RepID=A0A8C5PVM2_9ANUR